MNGTPPPPRVELRCSVCGRAYRGAVAAAPPVCYFCSRFRFASFSSPPQGAE